MSIVRKRTKSRIVAVRMQERMFKKLKESSIKYNVSITELVRQCIQAKLNIKEDLGEIDFDS